MISYVNFCTWLFHIFMNSFSPALTSVKSSIILLVLILNHSGSGWSSSSSPCRIAWEGMGRQVVLHTIEIQYTEIYNVKLPVMIEPVVTTDKRSLVLIRSGMFIIVHLEELWEGAIVPDWLAHQDVGDGCPLDRAIAGEGKARWLGNQVVRVANIGAVIQLRHWHIYPGSLGDGLKYWKHHNWYHTSHMCLKSLNIGLDWLTTYVKRNLGWLSLRCFRRE